MSIDNLGVVERKVLGALMIMANEDNVVNAKLQDIADIIGYKAVGGALTWALKILERDNFVIRTGRGAFKILI